MARDLHNIYNKLLSRYGDLHWWPASSPYEVIVGAVLTQNTAWSNVEKAIDNFGDSLSPEFIASLDMDALAELIRPSGFFNQKAASLKEITRWFEKYGYSVEKVKHHSLEKIRKELLTVKGVGKETADSILLYAFDYPTFVVDAYTKGCSSGCLLTLSWITIQSNHTLKAAWNRMVSSITTFTL